MGKVIALILILIVFAILWCLPLWLVANFVCWAFHLSFHLSFIQAFAICLLASVVKSLLFKKEDK
jgi:hypothetical protein